MITFMFWWITDMVKRLGFPLKLTKSKNLPFFLNFFSYFPFKE